jgi:hypothetical protein
VDQGFRDEARIRLMPVWEGLRENPTFIEILQRIDTDVADMRQHALDEGWLRGP